jgi:hypothetical protein
MWKSEPKRPGSFAVEPTRCKAKIFMATTTLKKCGKHSWSDLKFIVRMEICRQPVLLMELWTLLLLHVNKVVLTFRVVKINCRANSGHT